MRKKKSLNKAEEREFKTLFEASYKSEFPEEIKGQKVDLVENGILRI